MTLVTVSTLILTLSSLLENGETKLPIGFIFLRRSGTWAPVSSDARRDTSGASCGGRT